MHLLTALLCFTAWLVELAPLVPCNCCFLNNLGRFPHQSFIENVSLYFEWANHLHHPIKLSTSALHSSTEVSWRSWFSHHCCLELLDMFWVFLHRNNNGSVGHNLLHKVTNTLVDTSPTHEQIVNDILDVIWESRTLSF